MEIELTERQQQIVLDLAKIHDLQLQRQGVGLYALHQVGLLHGDVPVSSADFGAIHAAGLLRDGSQGNKEGRKGMYFLLSDAGLELAHTLREERARRQAAQDASAEDGYAL